MDNDEYARRQGLSRLCLLLAVSALILMHTSSQQQQQHPPPLTNRNAINSQQSSQIASAFLNEEDKYKFSAAWHFAAGDPVAVSFSLFDDNLQPQTSAALLEGHPFLLTRQWLPACVAIDDKTDTPTAQPDKGLSTAASKTATLKFVCEVALEQAPDEDWEECGFSWTCAGREPAEAACIRLLTADSFGGNLNPSGLRFCIPRPVPISLPAAIVGKKLLIAIPSADRKHLWCITRTGLSSDAERQDLGGCQPLAVPSKSSDVNKPLALIPFSEDLMVVRFDASRTLQLMMLDPNLIVRFTVCFANLLSGWLLIGNATEAVAVVGDKHPYSSAVHIVDLHSGRDTRVRLNPLKTL